MAVLGVTVFAVPQPAPFSWAGGGGGPPRPHGQVGPGRLPPGRPADLGEEGRVGTRGPARFRGDPAGRGGRCRTRGGFLVRAGRTRWRLAARRPRRGRLPAVLR